MMTASEMLAALKACLSELNGVSGRAATAVGTASVFPTATLTALRDDPSGGEAEINAGALVQMWTRHTVLEVVVDDTGDWDEALDRALVRVRQMLARYSYPLRMGGPTFFPAEPGSNRASFQIPLSFDYIVRLSGDS